MRTYHSNEIGNVVVLGHSGSGKTSVIEAMAYRAGITNRIGTIEDGKKRHLQWGIMMMLLQNLKFLIL